MQPSLRMTAVLLLGTILAGVSGALAAAVSPALTTGHSAGCHGHGPATPSPAPVSFQCCVNGHHAAIPNASFTLRSQDAAISASVADEQLRIGFACHRNSVEFLFSSNSPPGTTPLRL